MFKKYINHDKYCTCIFCFFKQILIPIVLIFSFVMLTIYILTVVEYRTNFPLQVVEIEQVRKDINTAPAGYERSKLIYKAVYWNIKISKCQYGNSIWWRDIFYSDGCDSIELIDIR